MRIVVLVARSMEGLAKANKRKRERKREKQKRNSKDVSIYRIVCVCVRTILYRGHNDSAATTVGAATPTTTVEVTTALYIVLADLEIASMASFHDDAIMMDDDAV